MIDDSAPRIGDVMHILDGSKQEVVSMSADGAAVVMPQPAYPLFISDYARATEHETEKDQNIGLKHWTQLS